jgi:aminoglycoside 6'-N-acetyltransferase
LFSDQLLSKHEVKKVIVDPSPKNTRSIRVYEKAGFSRIGIIATPDGKALLLEKR